MAITPRSRGLGNIGAIVDRQGRASPTRPVAKAAPKPAPKPVARVAPKPAPKLAPKPNPFAKKPDTRAPGGGGMDQFGNPIGGGMGAQMNFASPNLARNTGPIAGAPPRPGDLYRGGPQLVGGPAGRPIFGGGFGQGEPQVIEMQPPMPMAFATPYNMPQTASDFGNYDNLPPPPGISGNPYEAMPQPGDGMYPNAPPPGYNFGNPGLGGQPQVIEMQPPMSMNPGFGGQQPMFGGQQPGPTMNSAFNPYDNNDYGNDFMGGGSGSLFGGGGFAGK